MVLIKIAVSILMLVVAIYLITRGFAGETVAPPLLSLIGILMIIEMALDIMYH